MKNRKKTDAEKFVTKSNALLRCRWDVESVLEPRIVAILASQVSPSDKEFQEYRITVSEIFQKKIIGGSEFSELEKVADRLMTRVITIYDDEGWTKYNVVSPCRFNRKKGVLAVKFHPDLLPHFLNLKRNFAKYSLEEFLDLPSIYSQRIFEFLKSWNDRDEVEVPLTELHEMLFCPESFRKDFAQFRRRVLEKAYLDITQRTTFRFRWETIKSGKAVSSVRFVFEKRKRDEIESKNNEKTSSKRNKLFLAASRCAKEKGGICVHHERSPEVCKFCEENGICDDVSISSKD